MKKLNKNFVAVLFLTTLFSILFSGFVDYNDAAYSNMDMHKYIAMAKASPEIETEIIKPFVYRIGAPWLAGILPFSIPTNFFILNSIAMFLLSLAFYLFLLEYGSTEKLAVIITIIFQCNRYFFQFLGWDYFQLSDTIGLTMLFYAFILLRHKNFLPLFLIMFFGMLVKEYMLMIIPAGFVMLFEVKSVKKDYIIFLIISFISLSIFGIIRKVIPSDGGESLFVQYITQVVYYSKPVLLVKRFFVPFAPFALLPILFYKDFFFFFKTNKHLLVYFLTVIILSFFGESERLMAPLAPVFFLFIGELISKYFSVDTPKIKINKEIIFLIIIAFISSFYHLWGIIKLPDKYYSMTITLLSTLIVTAIFLKQLPKRKKFNKLHVE